MSKPFTVFYLCAVFFVSGCGQNEYEVLTVAEPSPSRKEVSIAYLEKDILFETLVSLFHDKSQGSIPVRQLSYPEDRYYIELTTSMLSGSGPDVMALCDNHVMPYVENEWLYRLDEVYTDEQLNAFAPGYIDHAARSHVYALPLTLESYRLIYNREMFALAGLDPDSPPATFAQLFESSLILKRASVRALYPFGLPLAEGIETFRENLELPARKSGVYHFDFEARSYDFSLYAAWFELIHEMNDLDLLMPGWQTMTKKTAIDNFLNMNTALLIVGSDDFAYINSHRSTDFTIGVAPIPALFSARGSANTKIGAVLGVNSKAESISDSLVLWNFLMSDYAKLQLIEGGMAVPYNYRGVVPDTATAGEEFLAFLPTRSETMYRSLIELLDSPIIYKGFQDILLIDSGKTPRVLENMAALSRERLLNQSRIIGF